MARSLARLHELHLLQREIPGSAGQGVRYTSERSEISDLAGTTGEPLLAGRLIHQQKEQFRQLVVKPLPEPPAAAHREGEQLMEMPVGRAPSATGRA